MLITDKGQVTIPVAIRQQLGLLPNTEVEFHVEGNRVFIDKAEHVQHKRSAFINTMRGKGSVKLTTDEIMALTRQ